MCYCMNLILQFKTLDEQCNITGASSGEGTLFSCSSFRSSNSGFLLDSCATVFTLCCFIAYKFSRISFLLVSRPKKVQTPKVNGMTWLFRSKITPIFFSFQFFIVCAFIFSYLLILFRSLTIDLQDIYKLVQVLNHDIVHMRH